MVRGVGEVNVISFYNLVSDRETLSVDVRAWVYRRDKDTYNQTSCHYHISQLAADSHVYSTENSNRRNLTLQNEFDNSWCKTEFH